MNAIRATLARKQLTEAIYSTDSPANPERMSDCAIYHDILASMYKMLSVGHAINVLDYDAIAKSIHWSNLCLDWNDAIIDAAKALGFYRR